MINTAGHERTGDPVGQAGPFALAGVRLLHELHDWVRELSRPSAVASI